jgi:hypothetical protein
LKPFDPKEWPEVTLLPGFERECRRLGLNEDDLHALEVAILANPAGPPVIQGTGGVRKIRFRTPGSGKGKSRAYRVCYAHFPDVGALVMVVIFGKKEKANLTNQDKKALANLMMLFRAELENAYWNPPQIHQRSPDDE